MYKTLQCSDLKLTFSKYMYEQRGAACVAAALHMISPTTRAEWGNVTLWCGMVYPTITYHYHDIEMKFACYKFL